ncbi:hypothetical protein BDQ17DRAFT_1329712 [Cyathus striatus]|nr:hypothetical protein BDQ17DRAFT_1329712 [Cyathus striatus]
MRRLYWTGIYEKYTLKVSLGFSCGTFQRGNFDEIATNWNFSQAPLLHPHSWRFNVLPSRTPHGHVKSRTILVIMLRAGFVFFKAIGLAISIALLFQDFAPVKISQEWTRFLGVS